MHKPKLRGNGLRSATAHYPQGRDGALRRPRPRQRAERIGYGERWLSFVPSPDASLVDGDGAARHPYGLCFVSGVLCGWLRVGLEI